MLLGGTICRNVTCRVCVLGHPVITCLPMLVWGQTGGVQLSQGVQASATPAHLTADGDCQDAASSSEGHSRRSPSMLTALLSSCICAVHNGQHTSPGCCCCCSCCSKQAHCRPPAEPQLLLTTAATLQHAGTWFNCCGVSAPLCMPVCGPGSFVCCTAGFDCSRCSSCRWSLYVTI